LEKCKNRNMKKLKDGRKRREDWNDGRMET
jgi:hypothetical protein